MKKWRVVIWSRGPTGLCEVDEIVECDDSLAASETVRNRLSIKNIHPTRYIGTVVHPASDSGWEVKENVAAHLRYHDARGTKGAQVEKRKDHAV